MKSFLTTYSCVLPRLLEAETSISSNSIIKLIIMGVLLVVFIVVFVLVSKKMKKK